MHTRLMYLQWLMPTSRSTPCCFVKHRGTKIWIQMNVFLWDSFKHAWECWGNICFPELVKRLLRRLAPSACTGDLLVWFWYQCHLKLIQLESQPFVSDSLTSPSHMGKLAAGVLVRNSMLWKCKPWVYVGITWHQQKSEMVMVFLEHK